MVRIEDAIVQNGRLMLEHLPFAEGAHVRVTIDEVARPTITQVRTQLAGGVERFDDPFGPMIPPDDWEMSK